METEPLTKLLKSTNKAAFERATKHQFLNKAGHGQISKQVLSEWLAQDHLYAQAYVRFIGGLLSKVTLRPCNSNTKQSGSPTTEQRIFDILVDSLVNIQRELRFFNDVAKQDGLDLTAMPASATNEAGEYGPGANVFGASPITHAYIDLFMSATSPGVSLLEGLTVLYATEYCYLHAWRYAADVMAQCSSCVSSTSPSSFSAGHERDLDGGSLRRQFIPNWTSPEFEKFVNTIGDVLDELAGQVKGAEEIERERGKCLAWWKQVLWLEERFWPNVS